MTRKSPVGAFRSFGKKKWLSFGGWINAIIPVLIVPYYSVIGGWVIKYLVEYVKGNGKNLAKDGYFTDFISNGVSTELCFIVFCLFTLGIIFAGVQNGIERVSKIMMPVLIVLSILIAVYSVTRPGALKGVRYFLVPNFDNFSWMTVVAAMGQMFYSMSLAMGIMITYGSYLDKKQNVEKNALVIVVCDTLIALMAGLAVMPSRFALDAAGAVGGPKLLFITMQNVFDKMGSIGPIFGILFYLLVVFAAISSSISLLEVIVAHFVDDARDAGKGDKRKPYSILAAIAAGVLCVLVCLDGLGENGIAPATLLNIEASGWSDCWLDFFDCVAEGILMPLGALLMCICIGWELGPQIVDDECCLEGNRFKSKAFFNVCVKYITPIIMILILAGQLDSFFGLGWFS